MMEEKTTLNYFIYEFDKWDCQIKINKHYRNSFNIFTECGYTVCFINGKEGEVYIDSTPKLDTATSRIAFYTLINDFKKYVRGLE